MTFATDKVLLNKTTNNKLKYVSIWKQESKLDHIEKLLQNLILEMDR